MIGARPSGRDLVDALRAAAAKRGVSLRLFVAPLSSNQTAFITSLEMAQKPYQLTIDRVAALIAGEPVPPARKSNFQGHDGTCARHHNGEAMIRADEIEERRRLARQAHDIRRPGETLEAAIKRLGGQG